MGTMRPIAMFFTKGVGKHRHNLQSFEEALRSAGFVDGYRGLVVRS